jgi:hypothetical protein
LPAAQVEQVVGDELLPGEVISVPGAHVPCGTQLAWFVPLV